MPLPSNRSRGDGDPAPLEPSPPQPASNPSSSSHPSSSAHPSSDSSHPSTSSLPAFFPPNPFPTPSSPGLLPAIPDGSPLPDVPPSSNAATAASAAGVRALTSQAVAFYFRAPVKAFFRTRVDYLAYARALHEQEAALRQPPPPLALPPATTTTTTSSVVTGTWREWIAARLRATTPAVLASAVRQSGWRVVPDQVLPPLVANVAVGAVLYTSYLQVLGVLHPESGRAAKRVYPPPAPTQTFAAGFVAGALQSVVAAPLDAVQARWEGLGGGAGWTGSGNPVKGEGAGGNGNGGRGRSMWAFSVAKLREIGVGGVFAGWGLTFLKDSLGSAVFFSTFEFVKAQGFYSFVRWYYGSLNEDTVELLSHKRPVVLEGKDGDGRNTPDDDDLPRMPIIIRPHYAIEPGFLLLAGMSASLTQQVLLHPLSHVQAEHWERLEGLDAQARKLRRAPRSATAGAAVPPPGETMWKWYRDAYRVTWAECVAEARGAGLTMRQWLYRGFWWNTIRQVPSTSAGLIIFELVRRKYGFGRDQVRINRDGYDILLR